MFKDLARRSLVSLIAIGIVSILLIYSMIPWFSFVVASAIASVAGVAIWECVQLIQVKKIQVPLPLLIVVGISVVFSFFFSARFPPMFGWLPFFSFFVGFLILIGCHLKQIDGAILNLATAAFTLLYIAIPLGIMFRILYGTWGGQDGRWWIVYLLAITKISDVGAYLGGRAWGKRKLAPKISQGKTVEGAFVGLLCSIAMSIGLHLISSFNHPVAPGVVAPGVIVPGVIVPGSTVSGFGGLFFFRLDLFASIILGAVLSCVGQFGDLFESLLKRDAHKKDSNVLPGLGGILDMIDSLLFNAVVLFIYLCCFV